MGNNSSVVIPNISGYSYTTISENYSCGSYITGKKSQEGNNNNSEEVYLIYR